MNIMKNLSGVFALMVMMLAASCQKGELAQPDMYTDKAVYEIAKEGGDVVVKLKATRDWTASVSPATSLDNVEGITVTPESGKASSEVVEVVISAAANESYARAAVVSFIAENVSVAVTVNQEGSKEREPEKLTVAQLLAKSDDPGIWYELTGTISNLANETYGNFDLVDETGKIYVYGLTATKQGSNDKSFSSLGLKEGDIVTLKGTRSSYNGTPQVGGPAYYVSHVAGAVDPAAPVKATVQEFLDAEVGSTVYELTGKISKITAAYSEQYNNISFDIEDATGTVNIYRMSCADVENAASIAVGDMITVQGKRAEYNEKAQMGQGGVCISHKGSTPIAIADFLTKEKSKEIWYKLTGTIKEIVKAEYGNFYLEDETGYVYVYGLTKAPVAKNDKSFESLGLQVGDQVTIVGTRDEYAGSKVEDQKIQVGGPAYYISHKAAGEEEEVTPPAGAKVIFEETFAKCNGVMGWSGSVANGTFAADNTGWTVANAYGAAGAAKFGAGSKLGSAQTPALNFTGTATLTFRAGAWNGDNTNLKISMTGGTLSVSTVTLKNGDWTEYEVTITGATSGAQIKFEGNAASKCRFFLDDVKIVQND